MMKEVIVQDFTDPMNMLKVRNLVHTARRLSISAVAVLLNLNKETVTCEERCPNFDPTLDSAP